MRDFGMCGIPELPERISVETRFISMEIARAQNLNCTDLGSGISHLNNGCPQSMMKPMLSVEVMTDSPDPSRNREVQTERNTNTIGIQCDLQQDIADIEYEKLFQPAAEEQSTSDKNLEVEKSNFQTFVKTNTNAYSNGKLECLLCGEIKSNIKTMERHLALHWGPQKLCFRCGLSFEHKITWKNHNCASKRQNQRQYIKCPHYLCGALVISPMELYDHLNEHNGIELHSCLNCSMKFPTAGELRNHLKIHKKCSIKTKNYRPHEIYGISQEDSEYRKRVCIQRDATWKRRVVKKFLSQIALQAKSNHALYCSICLRRCKTLNVYQFHRQRCMKIYKQRMKTGHIKAAIEFYVSERND